MFRKWAEGYEALQRLNQIVASSGLEHSLLVLVKLRASQINGCAFCLDMRSKNARAAGETEQRLYVLSARRETTFYTERERAALALAEAVTRVADTHVPRSVLDDAAAVFSRDEMSRLLYAIIEINSWNRLAITVGTPEPGSYEPPA